MRNIKGFDRINLFRKLMKSNLFVSAGGSTFSKIPFHSNKAVAAHYKNLCSNLISGAIGVSIGPFSTSREEAQVIKYLNTLDFVATRDTRSYEYLKSLTLPFDPVKAFDLAALLPEIYSLKPKKKQSKKFIIGVSICNYERFYAGDVKNESRRNKHFKELLEDLGKDSSVFFHVFIINGHATRGDSDATKALLSGIPENKYRIFPYEPRVEKRWKEIADCDFMISTRMHAAIFSCYAGIPFLLYEYHKKCSDFLEDVGHSYRIYDGDISVAETMDIIETIRKEGYNEPKRLKQTKELAELNFTQTLLYFQK